MADWGLALEQCLAHHYRGYELNAMGIAVDEPDGYYQFEHWVGSFWPYSDDCLLEGEHVYEDERSRRVAPIEPEDYITQEMAAAMLEPLIDAKLARL